MTAIQVDWGYALSIAGISILTVFILLIILIVVIKIQGLIMAKLDGKSAQPVKVATTEVKSESTNDDEAVMAAIAMALQLHYNSHDEVPGMLDLKPGLTTNTPWCARNMGMNRLNQE